MTERGVKNTEDGKVMPSKRWYEAIESSLEPEVSTIEYFESKVYTNEATGFQYKVLCVHEGYEFYGLPQGIYAETNITDEMYNQNSSIISPLTTKIIMAICEPLKTQTLVTVEVPPEISKDLPNGSMLDLANAVQFTCWGQTEHDGRLVFEIIPSLLNTTINEFKRRTKDGNYSVNLF